jgi:hypothetical protein
MRHRAAFALCVGFLLGAFGAPRAAHAFCRTTTSEVPADYDPSLSGCWTEGLPLYWANACVSYDLQQSASTEISYDDAAQGIATAFSKWTGTVCAGSGADGGAGDDGGQGGRVSIDVRDFGPVACGLVQYNQNGPNQHVIVFRDDAWPYDDSSNTLALTTVTYNKLTGEIYDADMEINSHDQTLSIAATVPTDGYDFESIVTHETGHFLGMAHSTDQHATMYAHYTPGNEDMRALTADDVNGICSIYSPDGMRHVAQQASPSGTILESACDATPRHVFTAQCMGAASSSSCAVGHWPGGRGDTRTAPSALLVACGALSSIVLRRRSRRTPLPKTCVRL